MVEPHSPALPGAILLPEGGALMGYAGILNDSWTGLLQRGGVEGGASGPESSQGPAYNDAILQAAGRKGARLGGVMKGTADVMGHSLE